MLAALSDRLWKRMLWIAALAALAYLPSALQLTYYRDDWYYAYDAMVGPRGVFRFMFAEDRPARGPFFEVYHALFGIAPTPFHLAMLFWRMAGGAAVAWLFHLLWPRRTGAGLAAGALFALYPGFTWWVQGIEYQPMVASAALMVLSLALTVLAIRANSRSGRIAAVSGAILSGWLYLSLVEYAAGMEILRILLVFLALRDQPARDVRSRLLSAARAWLIYLVIPAGFILWRFFVFTSERKATDLGVQLGALLSEPLATVLHWLISLLLSLVNVVLTAWVQPLLSSFFSLELRVQVLGLVLAIVAGLLAWLVLQPPQRRETRARKSGDEGWQMHAVWFGLAGLLLGILPVIVANRQITLPRFAHYALPASLGLVFLLVGLISLLLDRKAQTVILGLLVGLSALTHQGVGAAALAEERSIAAFWHQMAWRAPSIAPETTLLVYYPGVDFGSDSDVVWGPANFIYHAGPQEALPVRLSLAALTSDRDTLNLLLVGRGGIASTYRSHTMNIDYGGALIAVQSAPDACVRVLDPRLPMFSLTDDLALRALAGASQTGRIDSLASSPALPAWLFGPEPPHRWCYYFENASLAAQRGDWQQVAQIQSEVAGLGLHPNDQIEWMPFLQAQAFLGDQKAVKDIATRLNTQKLYRQQACENLHAMPAQGYALQPEMQLYVDGLFCGGQQ